MIVHVQGFDGCALLEGLDGRGDLERFERVKEIIVRQFDVELLHKWREVRILEEELDRGVQLKEMLEKLVLNGNLVLVGFCFVYD